MRRQRGVALLLALATAALATLLVTRLLVQADGGLLRAQEAATREQGWQIFRGGVDWACFLLESDGWQTTVDHLGEAWAKPIPATAAEGGELSGWIEDLDGRFDVNGLTLAADREAFGRLLKLLDLPPTLLPAIASVLPVAQVDALQYAPGMTPAVLERLRPYIAALPERMPLNANTATAEVLAASGDLSLERARALVRSRGAAWFRDLTDLRNRSESAWLREHAGVSSRYFLAHIVVRLDDLLLDGQAMIERQAGQPARILWLRAS